jgi:hypothetical protein
MKPGPDTRLSIVKSPALMGLGRSTTVPSFLRNPNLPTSIHSRISHRVAAYSAPQIRMPQWAESRACPCRSSCLSVASAK